MKHQPKDKVQSFVDSIDTSLYSGVRNGIFHLYTQDTEPLDGRSIRVTGHDVINLGSCSYMGLETDDRLKQGVIDALNQYGTQMTSSRSYLSSGNYLELEDLMCQIFEANVQISATTTLGHMSAMPLFISSVDAVIIDQRAHASMYVSTQILKENGVHVEILPHENMNLLEERIKDLRSRCNKVYYMIDGIYSMFGNLSSLDILEGFQKKYPQFHLYVDDAHGMSCYGKHGRGYVLSKMELNEQTIFLTGCAKGFGVSGAVLAFKDKEMSRKLRTCGNSLVFSGPINPPMVGALIESAKNHLTDEIYTMQDELHGLVQFANNYAKKIGLPLVKESVSPILYFALGKTKTGYAMVKRMIKDGYYLDLGIFPGVPLKKTGMRVTITRYHSEDDIMNMMDCVKKNYPLAFHEIGETLEDAFTSFEADMIPEELRKPFYKPVKKADSNYEIEVKRTIHDIPEDLWNKYLGDRGTIDWSYLEFLEKAFSNNPNKENNWKFTYIIIKDRNDGRIVAMTYLTNLICKDDMLSVADVSAKIEERRENNKYYLSSETLMMGSLLSEGLHLFFDRKHEDWKGILKTLLNKLDSLQKETKADVIQLRDFDAEDLEVRDFLTDEGYLMVTMIDTHLYDDFTWNGFEEYFKTLSKNSQCHFNRHIIPEMEKFDVEFAQSVSEDQLKKLYQMYKNVKGNSLALNTSDNREVILLRVKKEFLHADATEDLGAAVFCYKSDTGNYCPEVIGINYDLNNKFNCYRHALYSMVMRAKELECNKLFIGMTASHEKQRVGAKPLGRLAFVQANSNLNYQIIDNLT
ncbi:MAG: aminotransferase class I/II-fold pyridoxal phosphate-dependent enzyme [Flavobacteriales bacterium]|nr:aminotransferase class I/II-fold pyridoxal phosphate-dependent enzyme [Flavobacteriales bacterium]